MDKPPLKNSVEIGRFTLWNRGIHRGKIDIVCNEKSEACGEGGEFDEAELEKVIGEFYARHF